MEKILTRQNLLLNRLDWAQLRAIRRYYYFVRMFVLALAIGNTLVAAQYGLDGDLVDELVRVELSGSELTWTAQNLGTGTVKQLGTFGTSGNYPLVGVWAKDSLPTLAVLYSAHGKYAILQQRALQPMILPHTPREHELLLSGDTGGDKLTDLIFVRPKAKKLQWTILESPFLPSSRTPQTRAR